MARIWDAESREKERKRIGGDEWNPVYLDEILVRREITDSSWDLWDYEYHRPSDWDWDEWIESESPDDAEQERELTAIMKAMNRDINKMYLREWSRRYNRAQMQTMAYMMADMDYYSHIKIGNEQFLVFDLMNAWNETHPNETGVYIPSFEK